MCRGIVSSWDRKRKNKQANKQQWSVWGSESAKLRSHKVSFKTFSFWDHGSPAINISLTKDYLLFWAMGNLSGALWPKFISVCWLVETSLCFPLCVAIAPLKTPLDLQSMLLAFLWAFCLIDGRHKIASPPNQAWWPGRWHRLYPELFS